jgi:hypothetical protein
VRDTDELVITAVNNRATIRQLRPQSLATELTDCPTRTRGASVGIRSPWLSAGAGSSLDQHPDMTLRVDDA